MTGTLLLLALGCGDRDAVPDPRADRLTDEICNGRDDDCDGAIDEDTVDREWRYADEDRDGHGVGEAVFACPDAWATADRPGDCDDTHPTVYPGAREICGDGRVNDCAGAAVGCRHVGDLSFDEIAIFSVVMDYEQSLAFTSAAGVGDVDGDGLDDVVLGAGYHSFVEEADGGAYLYRGRSGGGTVTLGDSDATLVGPMYHAFAGDRVAAAGDIDANGLADVIVQPGGVNLDVWLLHGPVTSRALDDVKTVLPTGFDLAAEDLVSYGSEQRAAGPGDVDGDGYDDLLYVESWTSETGEVYLQRGPVPPGVTRDEAYASWYGDPDSGLGYVVERVGDLTGDGVPEVAMSAMDPANDVDDDGTLCVVTTVTPGRHHASDADAILRGQTRQGVGLDLAGGEDVDGDGYGDLLVAGSTGPGDEETNPPGRYTAAWLVHGPVAGDGAIDAVASAQIRVIYGSEARWGASVTMPGDLDADGFGDIAIGLSRLSTTTASGMVALYYGPVAGTHDYTDADARFWGTRSWGLPATPGNLDAAGDFDGDGIPRLVIGAQFGGNLDAQVPAAWVIPGAAW